MNLFSPLTPETTAALENFPRMIDKAFPLPARFQRKIKNDVAELSALFTSNRPEREAAYLGKPALLSAYLRYFLPWNMYRLSRLLPSLPLDLKDGDAVTDLGSGPLTLALALWMLRPELRRLRLEFRCVDRTPAVLEAGKKLFSMLQAAAMAETAGGGPWRIKTIKGEIRNNGTLSVKILGKPAALVGALNIYNEIYWNFSPADKTALNALAGKSGNLLYSLCSQNGNILVLEPGIPRSGEFISVLRTAFLKKGLRVLSPCPHQGDCPFPGGDLVSKGKAKWCHFAFDTAGAPRELLKLSDAAGIPKERGAASFILAGKTQTKREVQPDSGERCPVRIISDAFPVEAEFGRYGCSAKGAVLALGGKAAAEKLYSGSMAEVKMTNRKDAKSGALIGEIRRYDE